LHTEFLSKELLETLFVVIPRVTLEYPDQLGLLTMHWKIVTQSNPLAKPLASTLLSE
jgi:hypothetical protein